jgi:hypothetical protein
MTKDELYPVIDEVLHERKYSFTNAGSAWIDLSQDDVQLRIHDLAEALCDTIVERQRDLTVERDASRLIINDLTAEIERLRGIQRAVVALARTVLGKSEHPVERSPWIDVIHMMDDVARRG